jgi:hypothetical protein
MSQQPDADARDQAFDAAEPGLKPVALVQLIATVTLAVSTLIIATAVSIGLARAEVAPPTGADTAPSAITFSPKDGAALRC